MLDDIDVVLWKPLKNATQGVGPWPYGDPFSPNIYPDAGAASEYFPLAERYLTMQNPPVEWLTYFHVVPLDTDSDMQPLMPTDWQLWNGPYLPPTFDLDHWIAYDVTERIIHDVPPLIFCWRTEYYEYQYSTNLLEILFEGAVENWTKYEILTIPDQYTEFWLPPRPDIEGIPMFIRYLYQADPQLLIPFTILDVDPAIYRGDYLLTSALEAPNALGSFNRLAFCYDPMVGLDIYINSDTEFYAKTRIYGHEDLCPQHTLAIKTHLTP
jgi:hypothetical protein